jgi:hypothetical protein
MDAQARSALLLSAGLLTSLSDQLVHQADVARNVREKFPQPPKRGRSRLENNSIAFNASHELGALLDAELAPDRRWHHDAAFGTDLHRYRRHRRIVTQMSIGVTTGSM